MPGFKITNQQSSASNLPPPLQAVYTYTWDVRKLVKKFIKGTVSPIIYAKSVILPSYNIETENVETGHTQYKFAKSAQWADVKVTFYDTNNMKDVLKTLMQDPWTTDQGIRMANDYMDESIINAYYNTGKPAYAWHMYNSWIKGISFSELTYESSGINNVIVTVSYSWAVLKPID